MSINPSENIGAAVAYIVVVAVVVIAAIILLLTIINIISFWKIFRKAGVPGWMAIVPGLNLYKAFEIAWDHTAGWITLALIAACGLLGGITGAMSGDGNSIGLFIIIALAAALAVMLIIFSVKLAKAFGKKTGFALGLILLEPLFILILAFGKAQYLGRSER